MGHPVFLTLLFVDNWTISDCQSDDTLAFERPIMHAVVFAIRCQSKVLTKCLLSALDDDE